MDVHVKQLSTREKNKITASLMSSKTVENKFYKNNYKTNVTKDLKR